MGAASTVPGEGGKGTKGRRGAKTTPIGTDTAGGGDGGEVGGARVEATVTTATV